MAYTDDQLSQIHDPSSGYYQARQWLWADLATGTNTLDADDPAGLALVLKTLAHWQTDPDLATIRDAESLDKLPPAEREECRALWSDVDPRFRGGRPLTADR